MHFAVVCKSNGSTSSKAKKSQKPVKINLPKKRITCFCQLKLLKTSITHAKLTENAKKKIGPVVTAMVKNSGPQRVKNISRFTPFGVIFFQLPIAGIGFTNVSQDKFTACNEIFF